MKQLQYKHTPFWAAIVSLTMLCGCTETESGALTPSADRLYFSATLNGQTVEPGFTRAYTTDIDFATRGFTVAGYRTSGAFSSDNPNALPFPNVFDYLNPGVIPAVRTVKKDSTETNTNTNRQYWTDLPRLAFSNLYQISYFAWSSSQDNTIMSATSSASDKGAPWLRAKLGAVDTSQPDIVGAVSMNHSNEYTVSAIDLDFKHLLSKMSFLIKADNGMVATITKVACVYGASAVYSEALFTFDGTAEIGSWSDHKTYLNAGAVTPTDWNFNLSTTNTAATLGSMVFIPQSLSDDALSLNITYTTTQGSVTSSETTRSIRLKALDMKPGKNYIYTLDVNANAIELLNVKVMGWTEVSGTDKGLPLVPGAMDPDVLLLLDGTDPPYTTADGSRYWLDRSGWNHHCQIMDKTQYNGTGSFDITYDPDKRGYLFSRSDYANGNLYNHIQIPELGTAQGNISCEIVCHNQSSGWVIPVPFAISQGSRTYGDYPFLGRTLFVSIDEANTNTNHWDYAKGAPTTDSYASSNYERIELAAPNAYNWNKLSFYTYSRTNGSEAFAMVDNTNSTSASVSTNTTSYALKYGMIGAVFKGVINYVKVTKAALSFDKIMDDFGAVTKKYNIKTEPGPYAPKLSGLLACWDARTGLVQGASDGNGSYWMDQSGNGYYLRGYVPQGTSPTASITYNSSRKAIVFTGPKYAEKGTYMLNTRTMGKTKLLTFEMVYQSVDPNYPYALVILDKNGNRIAYFRSNTGAGNNEVNIDISAMNTSIMYYLGAAARQRRSLTAVVDGITGKLQMYSNGSLLAETQGNILNDDLDLASVVFGNAHTAGYNQAFTGDMYAFRVYNRALTASEIQANYTKDRTDFSLP